MGYTGLYRSNDSLSPPIDRLAVIITSMHVLDKVLCEDESLFFIEGTLPDMN